MKEAIINFFMVGIAVKLSSAISLSSISVKREKHLPRSPSSIMGYSIGKYTLDTKLLQL